jgi:hypothetical protein
MFQIQGQLHITKRDTCYFIVYTKVDLKFCIIKIVESIKPKNRRNFLILRNSSDFDEFFFLNLCIYILFEIRNILVGARKYLYCLNNNLRIMEKNSFSTIFISKIFFIWKLKYKE